MPALAPTSTPRVGSSKISTPGWTASHFASTTFCWLPPERKRASCSSERARSSTRAGELLDADRVRQPAPLLAAERAQRQQRVVADRLGEREALELAVLGDEAHAGADAGARAAADASCRRPRRCRLVAGRRRTARGRARCGRSPAGRRGRRSRRRGPRSTTSLSSGVVMPVARQPDVAELLGRAARREVAVELAAHHQRDELARVDLADRHRGDVLAVLQHRDAVADREDLAQAVGDVEHPQPALAQPAQQRRTAPRPRARRARRSARRARGCARRARAP